MARKLIKKFLPDPASVKNNRFLKIFGKALHDPQLWHLTRYSVAHAFSLGLFCAFIPVPFQMVIAAGGAILFRANLLLSVALVWITNPITMPVIFGFAYYVGSLFFPRPKEEFAFELSWHWLETSLHEIWQPFLLGCLVCGLIAAIFGHAAIRIYWRIHVANLWKQRALDRSKSNH
ncbi:DUF2062 domain-containing protein [Pleionea mediterranea]|uniref:DUF2062 domain-containing protein n=1 Tax=Pleionea mediterranea TaxID=523701 RepID=A0A316FQ88_9GAMM|nr:DUF2062 domain-containing protein [Pleionea mediterranea]PWK50948.1 hypothetical protein C8D97_106241 [Pleionea mediterranea]